MMTKSQPNADLGKSRGKSNARVLREEKIRCSPGTEQDQGSQAGWNTVRHEAQRKVGPGLAGLDWI